MAAITVNSPPPIQSFDVSRLSNLPAGCCRKWNPATTFLRGRVVNNCKVLFLASQSCCTRWFGLCQATDAESDGRTFFLEYLSTKSDPVVFKICQHFILARTGSATAPLRMDLAKLMLTKCERYEHIRLKVHKYTMHLRLYLFSQVVGHNLFLTERPFFNPEAVANNPISKTLWWEKPLPPFRGEGKRTHRGVEAASATVSTPDLILVNKIAHYGTLFAADFPPNVLEAMANPRLLESVAQAEYPFSENSPRPLGFFLAQELFKQGLIFPAPPYITEFNRLAHSSRIVTHLLHRSHNDLDGETAYGIYTFLEDRPLTSPPRATAATTPAAPTLAAPPAPTPSTIARSVIVQKAWERGQTVEQLAADYGVPPFQINMWMEAVIKGKATL